MKPHQATKANPGPERTCTSTYRIPLPWAKPPLSENDRPHHMAKAKLIDNIRECAGWLVRAARIPRVDHCTVVMYWAPGNRIKRDAENPTPTYKAICDGIVDAGVVPDDTPQYMEKLMPVILPPPEPKGMWLEITITQTPSGDANDSTRGLAESDLV